MQYEITSDDIFDEVESLSPFVIRRLSRWYSTAQIQGNSEREIERELGIVIKGAIESVTDIQPEHIIINLGAK